MTQTPSFPVHPNVLPIAEASEAPEMLLTPEQAERVKAHYDISVFVGWHNEAWEPGKDPRIRPLPEYYQQMAAAMSDMQADDAMFVEAPGFKQQPPVPHGPLTGTRRAEVSTKLEALKNASGLDVWTYGEGLAILRGIHRVYADWNSEQAQAAQAANGGKTLKDMLDSTDAADVAAMQRADKERTYAAALIFRDWLLSHLPETDTPPEGRKRKLLWVWGVDHTESIKAVFNEMHLDPNMTTMTAPRAVVTVLGTSAVTAMAGRRAARASELTTRFRR